ncbi:SslE/AcfD family lipoprotein zinc metalloprotease [Shewanella sp. NIFS-20-20]|uniref:SslE/AcfD family lipoprotein zinc metalloprotease n=1 Tax=Shewanella sp. NIFS-20-20 TaxID=2853806 RepID=UPI001C471CC4|nr:SslE/AcfD family lipoprotein zinc metalloprotease [Shewanella sp. NIFS-20-20]MBV7315407.1 SslE/AcfD family lipoprotein zinc metalloprotease [Shewanella sp. NIFS-20-20]
MNKHLIVLAFIATLSGCGGGSSSNDTPTPPEPEIPEPEIPTQLHASFSLDGDSTFGEGVKCNQQDASAFEITVGDSVSCHYQDQGQDVLLASFSNVQADKARTGTRTERKQLLLASSDEFSEQPNATRNAHTLISTMGTSRGQFIDLRLSALQALQFSNYYQHDLQMDHDAFAELINQKEANDNQVGKLPSTHVPDSQPAVTPGASSDLGASFVAANAEANYHYQPKDTILSRATLTDADDKPVAGVEFFSRASRGITNAQGVFTFAWGDTVEFGIDTLTLGSTRGNQQQVRLSQLGEGDLGQNIQTLVTRYSEDKGDHWLIPALVGQTFSQYPNVINEIIALRLSAHDQSLDLGNGQTQVVAGEFLAQFNQGQAQQIDSILCKNDCLRSDTPKIISAAVTAKDDAGKILAEVQKLWGSTSAMQQQGWKAVNKFHVFHDSTNFYGSTGNARGQSTVNIANSAFPILMARNDNNYWLPFGSKQAWDPHSLAYITEAPSQVIVDKVSAETATFNLPFISLGDVGQGKMMVMGNARYNSVLVCPNGYSWEGGVANGQCMKSNDSDDMKGFFLNVFNYLSAGQTGATLDQPLTVGTNIATVYFKRHGQVPGNSADFIIHPDFGVTTEQLTSFAGLDPATMPLLILNGFEYALATNGNHYHLVMSADVTQPKINQDDVSDLIDYMSRGGSILIMETLISNNKDTAYARLLDSAGIAFGQGGSVVSNGNGPNGGYADRPRSQHEHAIWVIERYSAVKNDQDQTVAPYTINSDGSVTWLYQQTNKPDDKPTLEVAKWSETNDKGEIIQLLAFIDEGNSTDLAADKARILGAFTAEDGTPLYQECQDPSYHYEINCLEYRPGNNIPLTGGMMVPRYTELSLSDPTAKAMIKAANLGSNIERLYQHELYFRSKGKQGERLSSVDLNRLYHNMTVWLWNNLDYRFEAGLDDELGFKRFTEFLNCYSANRAGGGTTCPADVHQQMQSTGMLLGDTDGRYAGYMNPSYPLNYMEKPVTRLMLGRSFWDLDIKVDIRQYPGEANGTTSQGRSQVELGGHTAAWFAGHRQATGQWAVAQQAFSVSVDSDEPITITVALNDDLTGREKHELGLMRPPRISQSFTLNNGTNIGASYELTVPYGGLIYAQGRHAQTVTLTFAGTVDAPLYRYDGNAGQWINPQSSPAPIGDVVSQSFIYTAAKANLIADNYQGDLGQFSVELDQFSADLNRFYGRDEDLDGQHNRQATDHSIGNHRHHFVNDVAISIGAAHSGYPVMNSSFNANSRNLTITPLNNWLLWHEVGHNAAEAPFTVEGATEVANNLLGLYMQDKHLGTMERVAQDIRIAPDYLAAANGQAWADGGAGERLVMFAQLKEWAETEFAIQDWYQGAVPDYYSDRQGMQGWNLFTLMHRLTRNADDGQFTLPGDNLCQQADSSLTKGDRLMLCASYASQTDLSEFFKAWNPGATAYMTPASTSPSYEGGISRNGINKVNALSLPQPRKDPLTIDSVSEVNRPRQLTRL